MKKELLKQLRAFHHYKFMTAPPISMWRKNYWLDSSYSLYDFMQWLESSKD